MAYERKTSDIFISDDLRKVLSEIDGQSMVASLLLKKRHLNEDLVEDFVNYISISREDNTKISYLTKERFSILDESEIWTSRRRFQAKPGGFVSKVFKNIPAREIELFSTLFRNVSDRANFNLHVVNGEEIRKFYHYEYYASDNGSLGASCMRYDGCQKYMDLYVDNPEVVSMLAMLNDDDELIGRALLWNYNGYKIMDRIYTVNDEKYSFYFKEWGTKNNYLFKSGQNWFDTLNFEKIGDKKQELKIDIKLNNFEYRYYPYMDTFKFFNPGTGTFSNYQPEEDFYTICSPDGSKYESDYLVFDIIDRVFRYRGDAAYLRYLNAFTSHNNVRYSDINDDYIISEESVYDNELQDYIFGDKYSDKNDSDRIERRRLEIRKRNEERARLQDEREAERSKLNSEKTEEVITDYSDLLGLDLNSHIMEIFRNITIQRTRRIGQTTQTEESSEELDLPF